MKSKLFILALIPALLLSQAAITHAAIPAVGDPGKAWPIPDDHELGQHIQEFIDEYPGEHPSELYDYNKRYDTSIDPTCKSPSDSSCNPTSLSFRSVLPICKDAGDTNCLADFGIVDSTGKRTSAMFTRYFPLKAQNAFTGDNNLNIPDGASGSIFSLPQAAHDGGNKYYLSVSVEGATDNHSPVASLSSLNFRLYPVELTPSLHPCTTNCVDSGWVKLSFTNSNAPASWTHIGTDIGYPQNCVASSQKENLCAQRYAFPAGYKYYVVARIKEMPGGWMHGRLTDPTMQITQVNGSSVIEIEGNPIAVPAVYKMYNYVDMPNDLKAAYDVKKGGYRLDGNCLNMGTTYCAGGRSGPSADPLNRNVIISPDAWSRIGMDQLKLWLPYVGDKATALLSTWSARTLSSDEKNNVGPCFSDNSKITGIVSTNATQYSSGPPSFDKESGTLNYKVAAPHFGTMGDVFKGTYDLVMRSDVARCVYGFSKAPVNATLSVTSADGTPQIATTVVGEKDGWLYLQAKNFEFSAPTVTAKLTQDAPAPAPVVKPVTKKITCVKGKVSKVVTTASCPSGFKKK